MIYNKKVRYIGIKTFGMQIYSFYLNEVRKNLASPGKPLLRRLRAPTVGALPSERRIAGTPAAPSL
jgi:hypothetical protein